MNSAYNKEFNEVKDFYVEKLSTMSVRQQKCYLTRQIKLIEDVLADRSKAFYGGRMLHGEYVKYYDLQLTTDELEFVKYMRATA